MKKIIKLFTVISLLFSCAFAFTREECYKLYPVSADNLFMSALSAINSAPKLEISEIQSKNGYILFLHGSKYYLLTVTKRYQNQTEIKILPQNSDYSEGSEIAKYLFSLIDLEVKSQPLEPVK